jgi:hypothetical protein
MKEYSIASIAGDGIGKEVVPEAQKIKKYLIRGGGELQTGYAITQDGDLYASGWNEYGVGGGVGGGPNFGDSTYNLKDRYQARSSFTQIFSGQRGLNHPEQSQLIDREIYDIDSNGYDVGILLLKTLHVSSSKATLLNKSLLSVITAAVSQYLELFAKSMVSSILLAFTTEAIGQNVSVSKISSGTKELSA